MKGTGKQLVGVKKFLWVHTSRALWATEIFQEIKSQLKRNFNDHDKLIKRNVKLGGKIS